MRCGSLYHSTHSSSPGDLISTVWLYSRYLKRGSSDPWCKNRGAFSPHSSTSWGGSTEVDRGCEAVQVSAISLILLHVAHGEQHQRWVCCCMSGLFLDFGPETVPSTAAVLDIPPAQRRLAEITELICTASLLRDDVNDHSVSRHSSPSANLEFGNKMAVLAGGFLL
jgi:hypothetical protein